MTNKHNSWDLTFWWLWKCRLWSSLVYTVQCGGGSQLFQRSVLPPVLKQKKICRCYCLIHIIKRLKSVKSSFNANWCWENGMSSWVITKNMQSNGRPFKLRLVCWVHWAFTSCDKGLTVLNTYWTWAVSLCHCSDETTGWIRFWLLLETEIFLTFPFFGDDNNAVVSSSVVGCPRHWTFVLSWYVSLEYARVWLVYCSSTQRAKQLTVVIKVTRTSELHILVQSSRTSCTYITGFFFTCDRAVGGGCTGTVAVIVWDGCTISSPSSKSSITTANESLSCEAVSSFTTSSSFSPSPLSSSSSWSSSIMQIRHILWLLEVGYLFPYIDRQSNIVMSEDNFHSLLLWAVSWIYYNSELTFVWLSQKTGGTPFIGMTPLQSGQDGSQTQISWKWHK